MRDFGSAWWHAPSLIVATTVMAMVVFTVDPTRTVLSGEILVFAALTAVLVRRDRRVYLPRRLEAERAGLIKRASIGPVPMLIWCAFVAATQLMPHHTTPVGTWLVWIGLLSSACAAMWQIFFPPRQTSR